MIRAERTKYSNGILKTRVSPILTHCNSYSQIPQERPKNFPKSCFWDVFVTLWALFLTGPPLKMFFFHWPLPTIRVKFGIENSKSDSDTPIFVTELQILVQITSRHVKTDDNGNGG